MSITAHVTTRIYGEVFGNPPFQNSDGTQSAVSNIKPYPVAPLTSVAVTPGANLWPLVSGLQVGNFYCYSIIEIPPTGTNHNSVKLATDTSVTNLISSAS